METHDLLSEQEFSLDDHVHKKLSSVGGGDVTIACWEPGQISPYHCHPYATEIYLCFEGGGTMRTFEQQVSVERGAFVVHPPGEFHEFINADQRTILYRVRYGPSMTTRRLAKRGHPDWEPSQEDLEYVASHPLPEDLDLEISPRFREVSRG